MKKYKEDSNQPILRKGYRLCYSKTQNVCARVLQPGTIFAPRCRLWQESQSRFSHAPALKDGTILKGELVSRTDAAFKFETGWRGARNAITEVYSLTQRRREAGVSGLG
jgi:hypothetical protein